MAKYLVIVESPAKAKKLADAATKGLNRFNPATISKQIVDLIKNI